MKLGISEGVGRQRDPRKVGSDVFDIVRLLQRYGPNALADELVSLADAALLSAGERLASRHLVADDHSATTLMLRAGVPVQVVSEHLGHASPSITMDVYAHVLRDQRTDATAKLAAAIDGP